MNWQRSEEGPMKTTLGTRVSVLQVLAKMGMVEDEPEPKNPRDGDTWVRGGDVAVWNGRRWVTESQLFGSSV